MIGLFARRRRRHPPGVELEHPRVYRIEARIPHAELSTVTQARMRWWLHELTIDWDPPAAGPEAAVKFRVTATRQDAALRYAERRLRLLDLTVLAIRSC